MAVRRRDHGFQVDVRVGKARVRQQYERWVEAEAAERELRAAALLDARRKVALKFLLGRYLQGQRARSKPKSVTQAEFQTTVLLRHFGDDFNVTGLRESHLNAFAEARRAVGNSTASINGALRILRAAVREAELPVKVRLLKETRKLPTILSADQVARVLDGAKDARTRLVLLLAAKAGLRHQEVLHLAAEDVDFTRHLLFVRAKEWTNADGVKKRWSPKNHQERAVPFVAAGEMAQLLRVQCERAALNPSWLFPGLGGDPIQALDDEVREAFQAAGLYDRAAKPGLHMLRRTFASTLLAKGADINTVRELGGWSGLEVMQRYLAATPEGKRAAVNLLE